MKPEDRDKAAEVRDIKADVRDVKAGERDVKAGERDVKASERDVKTDRREVQVDADVIRTEDVTSSLHRLVRFVLMPAIVMLIFLTGASLVRSFVLQDSVDNVQNSADRLGVSTEDARDAAVEARDELHDAVEAARTANEGEPELNNQAILNALEAIARIEVHLCGGPCPPQGE